MIARWNILNLLLVFETPPYKLKTQLLVNCVLNLQNLKIPLLKIKEQIHRVKNAIKSWEFETDPLKVNKIKRYCVYRIFCPFICIEKELFLLHIFVCKAFYIHAFILVLFIVRPLFPSWWKANFLHFACMLYLFSRR